jgi:hypothetical protein
MPVVREAHSTGRLVVFSSVCHSDSDRLSLLNEGGFCDLYGERGTEVGDAIHVSNSLVSLTLDHVPVVSKSSQVLYCS